MKKGVKKKRRENCEDTGKRKKKLFRNGRKKMGEKEKRGRKWESETAFISWVEYGAEGGKNVFLLVLAGSVGR